MTPPPQSLEELDLRASEPDPGVLATLEKSSGDILVAGAGGKMGFHLCRMLQRGFNQLGKSNRVLAVSRFGDASARAPFEECGITTLPADLTRGEETAALPDAGSVFYLAGMKFGTSDAPEVLKLFNEDMPVLVAERFAGIPIVALSTGCVYSFVTPGSGGSVETDPLDPVGDYAISCVGRERAFREASARDETPIALIRLNYSVDLRYGVLVDLAQQVYREEPVDVTMGYLNCIWQGDAVAHTVRALAHASTEPDPFLLNVTGSRILSVRELVARFGERFGKPVTITGEEAPTAWLNDASKSHRLFGPPRVSEDTLVDWVADWIESGRPLLGKPTHFEVRDGKY